MHLKMHIYMYVYIACSATPSSAATSRMNASTAFGGDVANSSASPAWGVLPPVVPPKPGPSACTGASGSARTMTMYVRRGVCAASQSPFSNCMNSGKLTGPMIRSSVKCNADMSAERPCTPESSWSKECTYTSSSSERSLKMDVFVISRRSYFAHDDTKCAAAMAR